MNIVEIKKRMICSSSASDGKLSQAEEELKVRNVCFFVSAQEGRDRLLASCMYLCPKKARTETIWKIQPHPHDK